MTDKGLSKGAGLPMRDTEGSSSWCQSNNHGYLNDRSQPSCAAACIWDWGYLPKSPALQQVEQHWLTRGRYSLTHILGVVESRKGDDADMYSPGGGGRVV